MHSSETSEKIQQFRVLVKRNSPIFLGIHQSFYISERCSTNTISWYTAFYCLHFGNIISEKITIPMAKSETKKDLFQIHLSNEERAPGCLGDLLGMKSCPVMQGLFQKP